MKRFLSTLLAVVIAVTVLPAKDKAEPQGHRVVQKTQDAFSAVVVNGNAVVDCKINENYKGYVVYYSDSYTAPRVAINVADGALVVTADTIGSAITSRVTVVCGPELNTVVVNGGTMLIREVPQTDSFTIVANGPADGFYSRKIKADTLIIANNADKANIGIRRVKTSQANIVTNGGGNIAVAKLKADDLTAVTNGSGTLTFNGRAKQAALAANATGDIYGSRLRCKEVVATVNGPATIGCDPKDSASINIDGSGAVMGPSMPSQVTGGQFTLMKLDR
jgi:hypothetical protein